MPKESIKIYRVMYDSKVDLTYIVHHSEFGLPDLLLKCILAGCMYAIQIRWVSLGMC